MDWLLRILGVSAKNRGRIKASSKAVKKMAQSKPKKATTEKHDGRKSHSNLVIDIEDLPYDEYEIVGESHYQATLEKLAGIKTEKGIDLACEVLLVCETGNKFDKNAVRVELGGETVGYLSRGDAESFREMLDDEDLRGAKVSARAKITGGWKRGDDEGHFGIALDFE